MRYHIRDRIIEMLPTIKDGVNYIKKADMKNAEMVFEDCLLAFQSIRTTLEDSLTEERYKFYNELILNIEKILDNILTGKRKNRNLIKESFDFKKLVHEFEKSLKEESEAKLEVLFIPYKYSMWDSLESIWEAAKDDPRCSAYVMPIPYYDRDENGLLADFHYEIEEYIKNDIPVVSYKDYDYTVIRPDIIYFHNPFDGNNKVTSVVPEFYTDNLKRYTDMLVYVPYGIPGNYQRIEEALGYNAPGVHNADKVIVHSVGLKNILINLGINPQKIEVLGSPKFDAIYNFKNKSSLELNNSREHKVILLTSSLKSFLNNENYLQFLETNIEKILTSNQLRIIWRYHPLFEATIKSIRPDQLEKFKSIKNKIKAHPYANIDKNNSFYNSFLNSDAIISDSSSLIRLYILTKKPVYVLYESFKVKKELLTSDISASYFHSGFKLEEFLKMVIENKDPLKEARYNKFKNSIVNSDGDAGKKIHEFIIKETSQIWH